MPEYDVDKDARTEEPTPRRLEEARERGQVPRSQELTATIVLGSALAFVWLYIPYLYRGVAGEFGAAWSLLASGVPDSARAAALLTASGLRVLLSFAPLAAAVVVAAVASNVLQFGFVAAFEPIKPDFNRINPARGLQRIFSLRSAVLLGLTVFKVILAVVAMYVFFSLRLGRLATVSWLDVNSGAAVLLRDMLMLAFVLLALFLVLALFDLLYQRYQHRVDLRMTREELKEEMRRLEGDPAIRARRRAAMRRMLFSRMIARVPEADVVVTNPTEFAVAIRYRPDESDAPTVIAKGRRHLAMRIRNAAVDAGIPIVERPVLARGLYHSVEVGGRIPPAFYQAVAEILAFVYRFREARAAAGQRVSGLHPGLESI